MVPRVTGLERVHCTCKYRSGGKLSKGDSRLFYDLSPDHTHVAVVGVGPNEPEVLAKEGEGEDIDVASQNIRTAAAAGTKLLQRAKIKSILLDDFNNAEGKLVYDRRVSVKCSTCSLVVATCFVLSLKKA